MNSPLASELDKFEDGDFVAHYVEEHSQDKYRELASRLAVMDLWGLHIIQALIHHILDIVSAKEIHYFPGCGTLGMR